MQAAFQKFAQPYYGLADIEDSAGLYLKVDDGDYVSNLHDLLPPI